MREHCRQAESALQSTYTEPGTFFARLLEITVGAHGVACFLEAYVNARGTHQGSPVLSVAGYLFDAQQAKAFDLEWREALRNAGIQGPFRMYECVYQQGEFETWLQARRDQLIRELVGIIKARMMRSVAITAAAQDIQDSVKDAVAAIPLLKGAINGPYTFCVAHCVATIDRWVKQHCSAETTVFYFFERGQSLTHKETLDFFHWVERTSPLAKQYRYRGSTPLRKEDTRLLEAAELLAWEWCNFYEDSYVTEKPRRDSLSSLLEKPHDTLFFDTLFLNEEGVVIEALHLIRSVFVEEENL
jgi:hypothetical protein